MVGEPTIKLPCESPIFRVNCAGSSQLRFQAPRKKPPVFQGSLTLGEFERQTRPQQRDLLSIGLHSSRVIWMVPTRSRQLVVMPCVCGRGWGVGASPRLQAQTELSAIA